MVVPSVVVTRRTAAVVAVAVVAATIAAFVVHFAGSLSCFAASPLLI